MASALLLPGDLLLVRPGETLPADGVLESAGATLSEALLSGESRPVTKTAGAALIGGSVNSGSALHLRVTRVGKDTALAAIVSLMERASGERPRWIELTQRAAGCSTCTAWMAHQSTRSPPPPEWLRDRTARRKR